MANKRITMLAAVVALASAGGARASAAAVERLEGRLAEPFVLPPPPLPSAAEPAAADDEPDFPFLAGEDDSLSISVGDTSHGRLVNAVTIEESEALGILPEQKKRDLRYGSAEIVDMIDHAAQALHERTGTRLWIGNVARRGGGDISWSVSHNSGRDADIAFCYENHRGEPVDPPGLVPLNRHGIAKHSDLRFDVERTWIVVEALLTHPKAQAQYLFISSSLKEQLLAHAADTGASPELLERAAAVLRQPGAAAPHHDHLHLRTYCTERDVEGGCVNTGVTHPWADLHDDARDEARARFVALLDDDRSEQRRAAIERLALLDARGASEAVAARLEDEASEVRAAAAGALARLGGAADAPALVDRFDREPSLDVRLAILRALGEIGGEAAGVFLARAVGEPRLDYLPHLPLIDRATAVRGPALMAVVPEAATATAQLIDERGWLGDVALSQPSFDALVSKLAAIEAAARSRRLEPVEPLVELLCDRSPRVRVQAAHALRMITNLTYWVDWEGASASTRASGLQRWRAAVARGGRVSRRAWLVMGFRAAGYRVPELRQKHAWELVRAVGGADHLSYNAQRVLMVLFDHHPPSLEWSKHDACDHWLGWIRARRRGFDLEKPPRKTVGACYGG